MELHAPNRQFLVPHTHDFTFVAFGGDFETIRQGVALDDERVIPRREEGIWHAFEQVTAVMFDWRCFAMHHPVIDHHLRAKHMADALMAEADPKDWNPLVAKLPDDFVGQP